MGAEQTPEAGEVVQELEPVDILLHCQLLEGCRAAQEDGKDLHPSADSISTFFSRSWTISEESTIGRRAGGSANSKWIVLGWQLGSSMGRWQRSAPIHKKHEQPSWWS